MSINFETLHNYEYLESQAELIQEEEEEINAPDSEFELEDKIVPDPSRDQGEDLIQLDDLSELSDIYEPVQSNDNEPNIVEIDDNSEELDFLDL